MPGKRAAAAKARNPDPDPDPDPVPGSGPTSGATSASASTDGAGTFWAIRGILAEKKVKGRLQYKVDWEDHPETGEAYPPTWVRNPSQTAVQAGP
jgi:hypothetical protein